MYKKQAIKFLGSSAELARRLGVTPPAISQWDDDEPIPQGRAWQIEAISSGRLRVDPILYRKKKNEAAA